MSELTKWVGAALVGTGQQSPNVPEDDSALTAVIQQLDWAQPEQALLGAVGAATLHQQIGQRPHLVNSPPLPVCEPDKLPCCGTRTAHSLSIALNDQTDLLPEILALIASHGQRVPPQYLPKLLTIGQRRLHLHAPISRILGERGRWLATQNLMWEYVQITEQSQVNEPQQLGAEQYQRMTERADRFVQLKGSGSRLKIAVTLPEEYEKDWQQDGIDRKSISVMGDRAWWLQQILQCLPLSYWQADPKHLIQAATKTDWPELLIRGWITATQLECNAAWASALFNYFGLHNPEEYLLTDLFGVLSHSQQENFLRTHLPIKTNDTEVTYWLSLAGYPSHSWSIEFSRLVLSEMLALLIRSHRYGVLFSLSTKLALTLNPQIAPEAVQALEKFLENEQSSTWNSFAEQFIHLLNLRQAMHQPFADSS